MNSHDPRLELIRRNLDGDASPQDVTQLESNLCGDAAFRNFYVRYVNVATALTLGAVPRSDPVPAAIRSARRSHWVRWCSVAAACGAFVALATTFFRTREAENALQGEAAVTVQVVHAEMAHLEGHADVLRVGEKLAMRNLKLDSGMARVRLGSGVLLDLHSPVEASFESAMRMRLTQGRVSADVGKEGKGFTVITDAGEVVDLGTRFGLEADRKGESRVAVFSGQVKVRNAGAGNGFTTLQKGEAVSFSKLAGMHTWQQVALAADAASLDPVQAGGLIEAVRDNRGDEQLHPFYGIVRGGIRRAAQVYTDLLYPRWAPRSNDAIPEWLAGADLILTYHRFRNQPDFQLTLSLRGPSSVFVMAPADRAPPKWLTNEFADTGSRIAVGPLDEGADDASQAASAEASVPRRILAIWRADVAGGKRVLGGLRDDQSPGRVRVSYSIAVKPLNRQP